MIDAEITSAFNALHVRGIHLPDAAAFDHGLAVDLRSLRWLATSLTRVQHLHDGVKSRHIVAVVGSPLPWRLVEKSAARGGSQGANTRMLYFRSGRSVRRYLLEGLRFRRADDRFLLHQAASRRDSSSTDDENPADGYLDMALARARVELRKTICRTQPARRRELCKPEQTSPRCLQT